MRTRIERIEGSVIALDVIVGREIDELRGATLTLWAIPPRALGINPAGPPAAPPIKTSDTTFDQRFKTRGNRAAFDKLLDEGLRARVIATLDRPEQLRRCLQAVRSQRTTRRVEIVVVDNNPASGLTPPVVRDFDAVVLVREPRRGLAYARNAGFLSASGQIAVATDDDVVVPPDWLERLLAPFSDPKVLATTGHVLPLELETPADELSVSEER